MRNLTPIGPEWQVARVRKGRCATMDCPGAARLALIAITLDGGEDGGPGSVAFRFCAPCFEQGVIALSKVKEDA